MPKINAFRSQRGWIEVICGPMFSGKSEELLRRIIEYKNRNFSFVIYRKNWIIIINYWLILVMI